MVSKNTKIPRRAAARTPVRRQDRSAAAVRPEVMAAGERNRRMVLGADYVERSAARAQANPFFAPLQEAVTGLAWGAVWGRPGLDLKTRSLITVTALLATGRHDELRLHLQGARNIGWSATEIQEIILHAACYCGMPVAVTAFGIAAEIYADPPAAPEAAPCKPSLTLDDQPVQGAF